jgi:hypothetical protein
MNYLITSGCSFTRAGRLNIDVTETDMMETDDIEFYYYPHQIQLLKPNLKVINLGNVTNDNKTIARSVIYKIEKLKKEGVDVSDISVIVQWSSFYRNSFFISPSKIKEDSKLKLPQHRNRWDNDYAHINDFVEEKNEMGENGYMFLTGGFMMEHIKNPIKQFAELYLGYVHSYEERMLSFFETIVMLQMYLKSNNIKYKMFNIANNFSDTYVLNNTNSGGFPEFRPVNTGNNQMRELLVNRFIPNTWNDSLSYKNNPYLNHYWNLIDWDSFWFYEEDGLHKYGGVVEWAIRNFNINDQNRNTNYRNVLWMEQKLEEGKEYTIENLIKLYTPDHCPLGHVSARMYNLFVTNVVSQWGLI